MILLDIDQGIHKGKMKVSLNEKRKKLRGFSFSINIANFEAFCWTKKLISILFFLKSVSEEYVLKTKMLLVFEVAFFATTYYLLYYLLIQFQPILCAVCVMLKVFFVKVEIAVTLCCF